jgi:hypothetical protein
MKLFSSSNEINDLIEGSNEDEIKSWSKPNNTKSTWYFFDIYESNKNVQHLCSNKINPEKFTKNDQIG